MSAPNATEVGARIKDLRELRKWSQPELGKAIGVSTGSIWRWERGDRLPGSEDLVSLSDTFGVTIEQLLFGGAREMPVPQSLASFFETKEGSTLKPGQKLALIELLDGREADEVRLRGALLLLLGELEGRAK